MKLSDMDQFRLSREFAMLRDKYQHDDIDARVAVRLAEKENSK